MAAEAMRSGPHQPAGGTEPAGPEGFDVVTAGETMAVIAPDPPGRLTAGGRVTLDAGGAESNVAIWLARAGRRVAWLSRLGADAPGRVVRDRIAEAGVGMSLAVTDPGAPTGLYVREQGAVAYYRKGSAASRMTAAIWDSPALRGARVVHLTGITPALSPSCHALVRHALERRPVSGAVYTFDVNHRPPLWRPGEAAGTLAALARRADVVFTGRDEAEALWGTAGPDSIRALLPEPRVLVVKDAHVGATAFGPAGRVHVPTPPVRVVDPVGAGDAFAAGYLLGLLDDATEAERLQRGHALAARAMSTVGDVAAAITARAAAPEHDRVPAEHAPAEEVT
jgi:2-dehydro-3-deoxygluconokinase